MNDTDERPRRVNHTKPVPRIRREACPHCIDGYVDPDGKYICCHCLGTKTIEIREGDEHGN